MIFDLCYLSGLTRNQYFPYVILIFGAVTSVEMQNYKVILDASKYNTKFGIDIQHYKNLTTKVENLPNLLYIERACYHTIQITYHQRIRITMQAGSIKSYVLEIILVRVRTRNPDLKMYRNSTISTG